MTDEPECCCRFPKECSVRMVPVEGGKWLTPHTELDDDEVDYDRRHGND